MISAIGETQEYRDNLWACALDHQREKFLAEMIDWKRDHRFAWEMMFGTMTYNQKVAYAESLFNS